MPWTRKTFEMYNIVAWCKKVGGWQKEVKVQSNFMLNFI